LPNLAGTGKRETQEPVYEVSVGNQQIHKERIATGCSRTTLLSIQIRATIVVPLDGVRNDVADFDSRSIVLEIDNLLDVYGDARECDAADLPI
jgi:hypothetical protein